MGSKHTDILKIQTSKTRCGGGKLKKRAKKFDKTEETVIESGATLRVNTARAKTLFAMSHDEDIVKALGVVVDLLEYAAPSAAKEINKVDDKIANKLDDIKLLISGDKAKDKILDKIEEVRVMVVERNNMVVAGV